MIHYNLLASPFGIWYLVTVIIKPLFKRIIFGPILAGLLLFLIQSQSTAVSQGNHSIYLPIILNPEFGQNHLPNPSFEGGWYHPGGVPELQIPDEWTFTYEEGDNPLAPDEWNKWVRPEVRVLPSEFLPPHEHDLFIWDGDQTLKVFKGYGSISFELSTAVTLPPGTYIFEMHVFPDLVVDYQNGEKVFAPDPSSGEVKLEAGGQSTGWMLPIFGEKNRYRLSFSVIQPSSVTMTAAFRGRWAIRNNGWFMDDWGVYKIE